MDRGISRTAPTAAALLATARLWLGDTPAATEAVMAALDVAAGPVSEMTPATAHRRLLAAALAHLDSLPPAPESDLTGLLPAYDAQGRRLPTAGPPAPATGAGWAELVLASLADVPVPYRQAVLLIDMEGWSPAQVAEVLELPVCEVKRRLHVARMALVTLADARARVGARATA